MKTEYKTISLYAAIVLLLGLASCVKEPLFDTSPFNKNNKVRISFTVPERDVVETRAATAGETAIAKDNIYTFSFKTEDGTLYDPPQKVQYTQQGTESAYFADLKIDNTPRIVYVVANARQDPAEQGWEVGVSTLQEVKDSYLTQSWKGASGFVTERFTANHPMEGEIEMIYGITTTSTIDFTLTRVTAKAVVKVSDAVSNFTMQGISIVNAYVQSHYLDKELHVNADIEKTDYAGANADINNMFKGVVNGGKETEAIYLWESMMVANATDNTAILIKATFQGTDGYYKFDFVQNINETPKYLDVTRNTEYTLTITRIARIGYRTAQEAIDNPAANTVGYADVDIDAKDANAHDIVTNGKYYMGFSNTELWIYRDVKATDDIHVTTVVHNVPASAEITPGTITPSAGITLSTPSNGIIPISTNPMDVRVRFADGTTTGTLTFRLGNMMRVITLKREYSLEFIENTIPMGSEFSYACNESDGGAWMRFSDGESSTPRPIIESVSGTLNMEFEENIGIKSTAETQNRDATFYAFRSTTQGRIKVMVTQGAFNVGTENASAGELPFIGTFHRANQTGERVLRFDQGVNSYWRATVMILNTEDDFIRLSTLGSQDPNIHSSSALTGDDIETLAGSQFGLISTTKTISGAGRQILFRIGMTSKLDGGNPEAKPRYGIVLLQHAGGTQYIYVRQGEAADYMMRPTDGWFGTGTFRTGTRESYARKVTAFNLSATPSFSNGAKNVGYKGGEFSQYPSQAGTFYQWHFNWAYMPTGSATLTSNPSVKGNTTKTNDPCPEGYHTPGDGAVYGLNSDKGANSEFRHSFFAYVPISYAEVTVSAQRFGCYADGWFDRLQPNVTTKTVSDGLTVAYAGRIFYNPTEDSDAHIFFPFTGTRMSGGTAVTTAASSGHYLTSSGCESTNHPGVFNITSTSASFEHNNLLYNSAFSIRCVANAEIPTFNSVSLLATNTTGAKIGDPIEVSVNFPSDAVGKSITIRTTSLEPLIGNPDGLTAVAGGYAYSPSASGDIALKFQIKSKVSSETLQIPYTLRGLAYTSELIYGNFLSTVTGYLTRPVFTTANNTNIPQLPISTANTTTNIFLRFSTPANIVYPMWVWVASGSALNYFSNNTNNTSKIQADIMYGETGTALVGNDVTHNSTNGFWIQCTAPGVHYIRFRNTSASPQYPIYLLSVSEQGSTEPDGVLLQSSNANE